MLNIAQENTLKNLLKHKAVLLDTNVLIESFQTPEPFKELFQFLDDSSCSLHYNPFIEFEFLRTAYQEEYKKRILDYLAILGCTCLPIAGEKKLFQDAIDIAHFYTARKLPEPELADCCIAAQLKRYGKNLFLLTRNHKHFSTGIFDRIGIWPIGLKHDVVTLAFYCFRQDFG